MLEAFFLPNANLSTCLSYHSQNGLFGEPALLSAFFVTGWTIVATKIFLDLICRTGKTSAPGEQECTYTTLIQFGSCHIKFCSMHEIFKFHSIIIIESIAKFKNAKIKVVFFTLPCLILESIHTILFQGS